MNAIERLVRSWKVNVGIPIFRISVMICLEGQNSLMENVKAVIRNEITKCEKKHITDWSTIKSNLRDNLKDYIAQKTKRNPMILPIIMEV